MTKHRRVKRRESRLFRIKQTGGPKVENVDPSSSPSASRCVQHSPPAFDSADLPFPTSHFYAAETRIYSLEPYLQTPDFSTELANLLKIE